MVVLAEKQKDKKIPRSLKRRGISRFCPFLPVRRPLWAADGPSGFLRVYLKTRIRCANC